MKNILKQIKQIFLDNKEYFIRCTIMTLIAGFILGISISLVVPASAADEPTESDQTIIPAGTYTFDETLTPFPVCSFDISFTASPGILITNDSITETPTLSVNSVTFATSEEFGFTVNFGFPTTPDSIFGGLDVYNDAHGWNATYELITMFGFEGDFEWAKGVCRNVQFIADTQVDETFATWFFDNTTNAGDVDPDPEYTISAGWYLWQEELLGEFIPHTLTFNYRTFQRVGDSGIPFYSYWSRMQFDNYVENDTYFSRLYYSSISNGRVLVYDDINGGWVDETYRRFYISSPLTLSAEDYFIFTAYTEYYGDTPPSFSGETVPSVPDPDSNIFTNIIGGVLDALDAFTIFGGFSLLDLFTTLLGGMALVWILKLLAGG